MSDLREKRECYDRTKCSYPMFKDCDGNCPALCQCDCDNCPNIEICPDYLETYCDKTYT